jgi:hypothetical protein
MTKQIDIEYTLVKTPTHIQIDGKDYPIHAWNIKIIQKYWQTGDESVLEGLKDFTLEF